MPLDNRRPPPSPSLPILLRVSPLLLLIPARVRAPSGTHGWRGTTHSFGRTKYRHRAKYTVDTRREPGRVRPPPPPLQSRRSNATVCCVRERIRARVVAACATGGGGGGDNSFGLQTKDEVQESCYRVCRHPPAVGTSLPSLSPSLFRPPPRGSIEVERGARNAPRRRAVAINSASTFMRSYVYVPARAETAFV